MQNTPPSDQDYQDPFSDDPNQGFQDVKLDQGKPAVAAAPGRVFLILGSVVGVVGLIIFNVFFGEKDVKPEEPSKDPISVPKPVAENEFDSGDSFNVAPPPPPVFTPPELPMTEAPAMNPENDGPTNEALRQRIRSSMLVTSADSGLSGMGMGEAMSAPETDPNLQFAGRVYESNTKAQTVTATHIGNLNMVIAQGKIIQAVLETVINTDLPGNIRAIVSRDIFPEAGDRPLIPKGSRLIGQYNSSIMGGQKRVYVVWTRVIRPDGVDVMINSPLMDQIGQAGVAGQVDSKFGEIFSRALMTSVVTISIAALMDEINGQEQFSQTQNTDGSTTTSSDATSAATLQATTNFGNTMSGFLQRFINVQPTIIVDQGTPVNVFVNRDLIFPAKYSGTSFIE